MARLSYVPFPFAVAVAGSRAFMAVLPFLIATGAAQVTGAGGQPLDPTRGAGEGAWVFLAASAVWNIGLAAALVATVAALAMRHAGARRAAWTWVAVASAETVLRVVAVALSPWLGAAFSAGATGGSAIDDGCCCIPVTAIWTVAFAGWLVATRDPLDASPLAADPAPADEESLLDLDPEPDARGVDRAPTTGAGTLPSLATRGTDAQPDYALLDEAAGWFHRPAG